MTGAGSTATWIWYPGDFEIWLHREVSLRRWGRNLLIPPVWRLDSPYTSVQFRKHYILVLEETVRVAVDGHYNIAIDGTAEKHGYGEITTLTLPAGEHTLTCSVVNITSLPALYIQGQTLHSDATWEVTCYNTRWQPVGGGEMTDPLVPPSQYRLATMEIRPTQIEQDGATLFADFGKETFGYLQIGTLGSGHLTIYYGESREEACSTKHCEVIDTIAVESMQASTYTLPARAFRYVRIVPEGCTAETVSALYEYLPVEQHGAFRSSNERLNAIWNTALYTLHLNTREFLLDGIKRDRWVWSGDAYQTALMNYYSFFDQGVVRRTLIGLRGKDPVETHINTILDYTFYWFLGVYDYYLYTGDQQFIQQNYEKILTLLDFCLKRRNTRGLMEDLPGDWVFVDWAPMDNRGEVSTEQLLFARSLEIVALFAELVGDTLRASELQHQAADVKQQVLNGFWDARQQAFVHNRQGDQLSEHVTRYPNIFALLFDYLDAERSAQVTRHVLLNDAVQKITTPYMRFYELATLCEVGEQEAVLQEMLDYWGGMLDLGATTFWETFDPTESGDQHTAMYGRPFGRSFCHGWGASPIYLLGKYYLGVRPLTPGYESYLIEPHLGGLEWIEGAVPMPQGEVRIYADATTLKVTATRGIGNLCFRSATAPSTNRGTIQQLDEQRYGLVIAEHHHEYIVQYTNIARNKS